MLRKPLLDNPAKPTERNTFFPPLFYPFLPSPNKTYAPLGMIGGTGSRMDSLGLWEERASGGEER